MPPDFPSGIEIFCHTPAMQSRIAAFTMMIVLALTPGVFAGGKKEEKTSVTFHLETEASDNPKMIFPQLANGQTRYFRRLPEVSLKDIAFFSPFPSTVGDDYGLVFKLKTSAINRMADHRRQPRPLDDRPNQRPRGGRGDDRQANH